MTKEKKSILLQGFVETFLNSIKKTLSKDIFEFLKKWSITTGDYGLYVGAVVVVIIGVIASIRLETIKVFLYSIGFGISFIIIQYIAVRFNEINEKLILKNETYMLSSGFTDAMGIFSIIAGVGYFFVYFYIAIKLPEFTPFLEGVAIFVVFILISMVSFNPSLVSIKSVKSNSAGEEAIGIISFFIKLSLKLVPFIYGIGVLLYILLLLIHSKDIFGSSFRMAIAWENIHNDMVFLFVLGISPFIAYVSFVFNFLIVDIVKAILLIPQKLDKLTK